MKFCKNCKGHRIVLKKNYTHGNKSSPSISAKCKDCSSSNIAEERKFGGKNKFRRKK